MKSIVMAYQHLNCESLELTAPSFQISDGIEKAFPNISSLHFNLDFFCFTNQDFTSFEQLEFLGIQCDMSAGEFPVLYSLQFKNPENMTVKIQMGKKGQIASLFLDNVLLFFQNQMKEVKQLIVSAYELIIDNEKSLQIFTKTVFKENVYHFQH